MPDNKINIHGNGNITIQGVNGRDITVNINEIDKFEAIVKQLPDEIVSQLLEKLNLQSGHNFTNAKNIVVGNITAGGNVHVGDVINNPNPKGFCTLTYSLNENDELVRETEFSQLCKLLEKNKIVQIIGKEGLGKTFLLRYAFNQLRKEYEVYGLFIFTENLNFQSTLVNDYRFSINDARFNTMNIEEKASYIITQLNNNSHKKQLLLFQDVSLKAKDLFVLEELINAKIILSTTDSIHEYPAIIELQPFTNEQLKTILGVAVTPEQIALFEQLENNPDCAVIIYRNIDRMDFNSSKNTLQEISTRLSQTQGDVTTIFMDIALDLFDLTPSEVWILLHFSVLPLRQYDRDDIALLLAEVRFACPELDAAIAAFAAECAWWADYIRRIDDENASTEPEFLDMRMGILRKSLTEVEKQLNALVQNFSKEKFIEYLNLDRYDSEDLSELLQFSVKQAQDIHDCITPFKKVQTPEGKIPDTIQRCQNLIENLQGFDSQIQDLEPDDDISFKLTEKEGYQHFHSEGNEDVDLKNILENLTQKGWLEKGKNTYFISHTTQSGLQAAFQKRQHYQAPHLTELINSLNTMYYVQANNRNYLAKLYEAQDTVNYISYADTLLGVFTKENHSHDTLMLMKKLIDSHIEQRGEQHYAIADRSYEAYIEILEYIEPEDTGFKAEAYLGYANLLRELGQPQKGLQYAEIGKQIYEAIYPINHHIFGHVYNGIGMLNKELGMYEKARQFFIYALEIDEQIFYENYLSTTNIYSNLATVLQALGDYKGAKELFEEVVKLDELNFGENHPTTAIGYSNLAIVLNELGDYEGAKPLLEKAVESMKVNFGENHPQTAQGYSNLAGLLATLGDYKRAEKLIEKTIESSEVNFGENHPTTAIRYSNLATILTELGNYEGAEKLLKKAIKSDEQNFGENHPITAIRYYNLAIVYLKLNDYSAAAWLLEKAYRVHVIQFGEANPKTKIVKENLEIAKSKM